MPLVSCCSCQQALAIAPDASPILEMDTLHRPPRSPPGTGSSSDEKTVGLVLTPGVGRGKGISVLPYLQAAPQLLQAVAGQGSADQIAGAGNRSQLFLSNF